MSDKEISTKLEQLRKKLERIVEDMRKLQEKIDSRKPKPPK